MDNLELIKSKRVVLLDGSYFMKCDEHGRRFEVRSDGKTEWENSCPWCELRKARNDLVKAENDLLMEEVNRKEPWEALGR